MTKQELESVTYSIGSEGFDYCFRGYSDFKDVTDKKFHTLRKEFERAADRLQRYLENEADRHGMEYSEMLG